VSFNTAEISGTPPHTLPSSPSGPTQLPSFSGTGNDYRPKCGDALRVEKAGVVIASVEARAGVQPRFQSWGSNSLV